MEPKSTQYTREGKVMGRVCLIFSLFISLFASHTYADINEKINHMHELNPILDKEEIIQVADTIKRATDSREIYNKNSPEFLETYGKIFVNGAQRCTGNIVVHKEGADSHYVTTAAHCFKNNEATKARITIEFTKRDGTMVRRRLTTHKIDKEYDYAIMKLDRVIPNSLIRPLMVADYNYDEIMTTDYGTVNPYSITYAGFSSDKIKGDGGRVLTYDRKCKMTGVGSKGIVDTNCIAYHGASGGAFVISVTDKDNNDKVTHYFVGVNHSGGFNYRAKDKPQVATFVEHGMMYDDLMDVLK